MVIPTTPAGPQPGMSAEDPSLDVPAAACYLSPQLPAGGSPAGSASGPGSVTATGSATATAVSPALAAVTPPTGAALAGTAAGGIGPRLAMRSLRSRHARHQ